MVVFHEVGEEVLEGAEAAALGADAEGFAVGFAPPPEVALVAFEDGFGDGLGFCQVALRCPEEEDFQSVAAAFDGVGRVVAHGEVLEVGLGELGEGSGFALGEVLGGVAAALVLVALAKAVRCFVSFFSFFAGHGGLGFSFLPRRRGGRGGGAEAGVGVLGWADAIRRHGWMRLRRIGFRLLMCVSTKPQSSLWRGAFFCSQKGCGFVIAKSQRGREVPTKPLEVGFAVVGFMRFSSVASSRR